MTLHNFIKKAGFVFLLVFASSQAFSQGGFVLTGYYDSIMPQPCDSVVVINFAPMENYGSVQSDMDVTILGTNYQNDFITVQISWGDGTSTTHAGQMTGIGENIVFSNPTSHIYSTTGTYPITMIITNTANNTQITATSVYDYQCGLMLFSYTTIMCNNLPVNSNSVPFIFEGNGTMTEIYLTNQMNLVNVPPGTYAIYVSPWWLTANGLTQITAPLTNVVLAPGQPYTMQTALGCDPNSTQNCVSGLVFCDENENGFYESGETLMSGAQVVLNFGGQQVIATANVDGFYSIIYSSLPSDPWSYIELNPTWLSQNNVLTNSFGDSIQNTSCNMNGQVFNFPLMCDSMIQVNDECLSGWIFCDTDNDGLLDPNEMGFSNAPVTITGLNATVTVYTDYNGTFYYEGNDLGGTAAVVSIDQNWLQQNGYFANGPMIQTVMIDCNSNPGVLYFPIICDSIQTPCADLWTSITPWIGYYQNTQNSVYVQWGNNGPNPAQNYTLTLTFPAGVTPVTSSISNQSYTISGNTISWTVSTGSSYFSMTDVIYFMVPGGLTNGTLHTYSTSIVANGNNQDCYTSNNNSTLNMFLGNSYDPNDKSVNLPEMISPDVQDELTYHIRFQNTGTAPAQDIYILDTLSANLDWSTFELLDATHYIQVIDLGGGVMKFNFPSIWLPDSTTNLEASQGSLTYRIQENAGNGIGTQIENTAFIYFDWNPAIVTNTTLNENNILSVQKLDNAKMEVYPNPFGDVLNIRADENVSAIRIFDLTGKLIASKSGSSIQSIATTDLKTGVYLVEITAGSQTLTKRVIKK